MFNLIYLGIVLSKFSSSIYLRHSFLDSKARTTAMNDTKKRLNNVNITQNVFCLSKKINNTIKIIQHKRYILLNKFL